MTTKKYVNLDAIAELERESLPLLIKKYIEAAEKVNAAERDQQLLDKLYKLDKLSSVAQLDLPSKKTARLFTEKYFSEITKLIKEKLFEEARLLAILEMKGLNAYLNSKKKFKNIWPQYLVANRWRKKDNNKAWVHQFTPFTYLLLHDVVTFKQCVKYPFAFTILIRVVVLNPGVSFFKTVLQSTDLTINQRRSLVKFLQRYNVPVDYSVDDLYKMWLESGSDMYKSLLPISYQEKLPPENGFDFVFEAVKSKKIAIIRAIKSCPRIFEPNEKGIYPIEYIMAWSRSRKDWFQQFAKWHHEEEHWKRNNLKLLQRRLKHSTLDINSAFFFYATMGFHSEATKFFRGLQKGVQTEPNNDSNVTSIRFPLSSLPIDIIHVISKHLSLTSVMALTLTCKSVNQMINTSGETFWRQSLAITCPRSKFDATKSTWKETAVKEFKTRQNLVIDKSFSYQLPWKYHNCHYIDENWVLFHHSDGTAIHRGLFDCHGRKLLPLENLENVGLPIRTYFDHFFLNSRPGTLPTICCVRENTIYYQRGQEITIQNTPYPLNNSIGLGADKIYFNDFIWDVEKATQVMKFDNLNTKYQYAVCHKIYNEKSNTLMLAKDDKFFIVDVRTGQQTCHDFAAGRFDLIEDHVVGYVSCPVIGTFDLRMNRQDILHSDPIYDNCFKVLVSGIAQKALIKRNDSLVVQWDFRERAWDSVFFHDGYLLAMNSRQRVTYRNDTMYIEDYSS